MYTLPLFPEIILWRGLFLHFIGVFDFVHKGQLSICNKKYHMPILLLKFHRSLITYYILQSNTGSTFKQFRQLTYVICGWHTTKSQESFQKNLKLSTEDWVHTAAWKYKMLHNSSINMIFLQSCFKLIFPHELWSNNSTHHPD